MLDVVCQDIEADLRSDRYTEDMGEILKTKTRDWGNGVSMIVPTFRRPAGLATALESLTTQSANGRPLELIVADNDPAGSAESFVNTFANSAPFPVIYIHVPEPGVANARNKAVELARGRYLAFLDDDQFASENWLTELLRTLETCGAGVGFTAVYARSTIDIEFKPQCLDFFTRDIGITESGIIEDFFGCGSSIIDRNSCKLDKQPFNPQTNETGGEDDGFFSELKSQGVSFAWARQAHAVETVEAWRMSHKYIRIRSFAYGQGPSRLCVRTETWDIAGLIKWTVIGLGQFCIFTPLAVVSRLINHQYYIPYMRKASEGAGKVLWMERFRPRIYGAAALKKGLERENRARRN